MLTLQELRMQTRKEIALLDCIGMEVYMMQSENPVTKEYSMAGLFERLLSEPRLFGTIL